MKIMYYYQILQIKVYCSFCNNYFWIFISFFFLVCVLLIKELMNFFIAFIDKGNRIYIKRSFNRKYYDDMIKLDSITDIENQFYGNVIDYF